MVIPKDYPREKEQVLLHWLSLNLVLLLAARMWGLALQLRMEVALCQRLMDWVRVVVAQEEEKEESKREFGVGAVVQVLSLIELETVVP